MRRRGLSLLAAFALAGGAAACGGDESAGGTGASGGQPSTGATVKVDMKDIKFVPENARVKAGQTVGWTNSDSVAHTVTKQSGPGPEFDSGTVQGGGNFEQAFPTPGKIAYFCKIHPNQKGTITVE